MSGVTRFLKSNRVLLIMLPILAGEYYVWWRIQKMERFVPQDQQTELFVRPLEYAQKLYAGTSTTSSSRNDNN